MKPKDLPHHHNEKEAPEGLLEELSRLDHFRIIADIFKQLGDPTRVRLFWFLCHREECVINLAALMELSSPALSHHLRLLKTSGLIVSRRHGKEVYYQAARTPQSQMLHDIIEQVMEIACPAEE